MASNPNWPSFPGVENMSTDADGRPVPLDLIPGKQQGTPLNAAFLGRIIRFLCDLQDASDDAAKLFATVAALQNEVQRAEAAEKALSGSLGNYVSGRTFQGQEYSVDWPVTNLGVNKTTAEPWLYSENAGGYVFLATQSDLATGSRLVNKQVFGTGGNYTYTPTAGTTKIIVKLCGAGGGGGGVHGNGSGWVAASFGGAGGTYAETPLIPVPSAPVSVVVGSGGAGGIGFNYGGNGGVSSFGTIVTCPGGPGGARGSFWQSGGQLAYSSWSYSTPPTGNALFYAQGSGPSDIMVVGSLAAFLGSRGGGSFFGDGALSFSTGGGTWSGNNLFSPIGLGSGSNAFITGTGGAGAVSNGSGDYNGGNGADGIVIIEEYC